MTDETLEAGILQLRAKALETLGQMKDLARRPQESNTVEQLVLLSMRLAQLEGAMITLQQYAPGIREAGLEALRLRTSEGSDANEEEVDPIEEPDEVKEGTDLATVSPAYRRSQGLPPAIRRGSDSLEDEQEDNES